MSDEQKMYEQVNQMILALCIGKTITSAMATGGNEILFRFDNGDTLRITLKSGMAKSFLSCSSVLSKKA